MRIVQVFLKLPAQTPTKYIPAGTIENKPPYYLDVKNGYLRVYHEVWEDKFFVEIPRNDVGYIFWELETDKIPKAKPSGRKRLEAMPGKTVDED